MRSRRMRRERRRRRGGSRTRWRGAYRTWLLVLSGLVLVAAVVLAGMLSRLVTARLSMAVQEMQTSAAQLQSTATEQATGAREQATAMSEITTTMTELLTTSRQIADSSQRVAAFSRETAEAAGTSDTTVGRAQESLHQMSRAGGCDCGTYAGPGAEVAQIGGLVDVIFELAEQTNILAINANIEAAGAATRTAVRGGGG